MKNLCLVGKKATAEETVFPKRKNRDKANGSQIERRHSFKNARLNKYFRKETFHLSSLINIGGIALRLPFSLK